MPYNPGIQDISGQLLAQGMQARAQGIAGGVTTLFQGLQQNQMMTNQAIARFQAATAANPKLLDFLNKAGSEESPIPVNPDVLKAYSDVKSGKTNVQNTALLAQFADSYNQAEMAQQQQMFRQAQMQSMASENQLRQAQTMKTLAELQGVGVPRGQVMTLEDFRKLPSDVDAKAEPVPGNPNLVSVTGYNLRAPQPAPNLQTIGAEGGTIYDPVTGETRVIPRQPTAGPGEMIVMPSQPQGPMARFAGGAQQAKPVAGAVRSVAGTAPSNLPQFLPSGSMAPAGVQMTPQPPAAALAAMGEPSGIRIVPIPGGEAERKAQAAAKAEVSKAEREMRSSSNILDAIGIIERNKDKTAFGVEPIGMFAAGRRTISQPAVNINAALDTIRANIGFLELRDLKESGTSIGNMAIKELENLQAMQGTLDQNLGKPEFDRSLNRFKNNATVRMERMKLLKDAFDAGQTKLEGDYKKRFDQLGERLLAMEKQAASPAGQKGLQFQGAPSGGNVMRLNVQRGETAGTATLAPSAPDLSAFEGRVLINPAGKRVRIINGQEVPIQ